ncbi:MAG: O-antigen ligase family protein [Planctomycetes bacterium]|nr:O-antigen ligase family protein [Planctomycetota bacterium]
MRRVTFHPFEDFMRISIPVAHRATWLLLPVVAFWAFGVSLALATQSPQHVVGWVLFAGFGVLVLARPVVGMAALFGLVSAKHLLMAWLPALERPFLPIAMLVLVAAFFERLRRGRLVLSFGKGYLCLCAFLALALASSTQAVSAFWYHDYLWRLLIGLVLFTLFVHQNDDARVFRLLVWSLIVWTVANAVAGCVSLALGGSGFRYGRLTGWMGDPNDFAIGLAIAVPLILGQWRVQRSLVVRFMLGAALAAIFACILFSESRGGLAFLGLGLVWAARSELRWSRLRTGLLVLSFVGLVVILLPEGFRERLDSLHDSWAGRDRGHATSVVRRVALVRAGLDMTWDRPITGVGLGNFRVVASRYEASVPHLLPAHNMFVEIMAEVGVLALVAYLAWLGRIAKHLRDAREALARMDEGFRSLHRGLVILVVLYLVSGLLRNCEYDAALWALLGLVVAGAHVAREAAAGEDALQSPN